MKSSNFIYCMQNLKSVFVCCNSYLFYSYHKNKQLFFIYFFNLFDLPFSL
ncbi:hypothetical protein CsatB_017957 [Cannabis sativa]